MRLLFCNITWLDYYKGIFPGVDMPHGGGDYVKKTNDAHEKYNFEIVPLEFIDNSFEHGEYCLGFVETKTTSVYRNQLHIEKIEGCDLWKDQEQVDDVLVIYCAKHPAHGFTTVIGWFNHATVFRNYQEIEFISNEAANDTYVQAYNAIAKVENCVLLPRKERSNRPKWFVPRNQKGVAYGFGQSNVWFAQNEDSNELLDTYLKQIEKQIQGYDGENWLNKYPDIQ